MSRGRALIVYHPGGQLVAIINAYVEGLVETGWRCEMTTRRRKHRHS